MTDDDKHKPRTRAEKEALYRSLYDNYPDELVASPPLSEFLLAEPESTPESTPEYPRRVLVVGGGMRGGGLRRGELSVMAALLGAGYGRLGLCAPRADEPRVSLHGEYLDEDTLYARAQARAAHQPDYSSLEARVFRPTSIDAMQCATRAEDTPDRNGKRSGNPWNEAGGRQYQKGRGRR